MSKWVNNKYIRIKNIEKPCHKLHYCPYGQLVEMFWKRKKLHKKYSCKVFGKDCPIFYHYEKVKEDKKCQH
jgi:hypothetical protein